MVDYRFENKRMQIKYIQNNSNAKELRVTSQALQSRNNARQGMTRDFALIDSGMQTDRVCAYVKEAATACPLDNPFPFSSA